MTRKHISMAALALCVCAVQSVKAQDPIPENTPASQLPPIKPLGAVFAKSKELLGSVSAVRSLPNGKVLVNDISGRKVVLFDSTLSTSTLVADTTSATANAYSSRAGGLVKWKGDSTLFVDPLSLSMLVIDGKGNITRVMSAPRANDVNLLIGGPNGTPGTDAQGRLIYRGNQGRGGGGRGPNGAQPIPTPARAGGAAATGSTAGLPPGMTPLPGQTPAATANTGNNRGGGGRGGFGGGAQPDSAPLVRFDMSSRKLDTIAFLKVPVNNVRAAQGDDGRMNILVTINPLPVADDWSLMADGSVAVVRARDYHVDWVRANGTTDATGKTPFDWKRMSEEEKTAFLDSTKASLEKLRVQAQAGDQAGAAAAAAAAGLSGIPGIGNGGGGGNRGGDQGGGGRGGRGGGDTGGGGGFGGGGGGRGGRGGFEVQPINMVSPNEMSDFVPPFTPGAALGDADGNLWVRTTRGINGGSIYDVLSPKGELLKRVGMPPGRVISGFGKGGIVYMGVREEGGVRLEAARAP